MQNQIALFQKDSIWDIPFTQIFISKFFEEVFPEE